MTSLASVNLPSDIIPQVPLVSTDYDWNSDILEDVEHYADKFARILEQSEGRSLKESYRSDTLSDIKYGLGKLGTVIKIATAVLSLFGAEDTVDR